MKHHLGRREFLGLSAAALPLSGAPSRVVVIVIPPDDPLAAAPPVRWAVARLEAALVARSFDVRRAATVPDTGNAQCVLVAGAASALGQAALQAAKQRMPGAAEALALLPVKLRGRSVLAAVGHDTRGLVYAILDLADRLEQGAALDLARPVVEQPANRIRSVSRLFSSDVEDLPWFHDREMWPRYFDLLAAQRFNRFHLALGIGYDFIRQVTDAYFLFAYPFLLSVPGHDVRVPELPAAERDRNLESLRFIGDQAALRGLDFQLGIWTHGYVWINSPHPNYTIAGITAANHGAYSRDALRLLLQQVPSITGVTLRVHGESGVEEGSYTFWKQVFEGAASCGRRIQLDLHAKGMDQTMIDTALATRLPVSISPKYWAEHLGMPYHQANIRQAEKPVADGTGLMKFSAGSRNFLRYGYGDLLREDRGYDVLHRIWPGTQRLLLWGDPLTAAAYSQRFSFCGSAGVDIMEPLSFKGRRGSGIAGDRCAYADASLRPRWDWQKYEYGHRVWGRLLYSPGADADGWERHLKSRPLRDALAQASRILPIVTTTHLPSAANNNYWPEMYLNHSLIDERSPYSDMPAPKVFGNVSPLDPQLFSRINDHADALLDDRLDGKYSPVEVAQWLDDLASGALAVLPEPATVEARRIAIDVAIQAGLGRFYAAKFRAGVLYRLFERTQDRAALDACLDQYRRARDAWKALAEQARTVYQSNVTVGELPQLRGHWLDRLPAIEKDIALVEGKGTATRASTSPRMPALIAAVNGRPSRPAVRVDHTPVERSAQGQAVAIALKVAGRAESVKLYYRHVHQAESWEVLEMTASTAGHRASIPAAYATGPYPLEYYFEIRMPAARPVLYPGFNETRTNQPYFVVRLV